jgi:hypothetical protein
VDESNWVCEAWLSLVVSYLLSVGRREDWSHKGRVGSEVYRAREVNLLSGVLHIDSDSIVSPILCTLHSSY